MSTHQPSPVKKGKRSIVLDAARALFLERGFEATSMDMVVERAGVSKATLYNHFESKTILFTEVMRERYEAVGAALPSLDPDAAPAAALADYARRLIAVVTEPEHLALVRVVIGTAASHPDISEAYFRHGKSAAFHTLGTYLEDMVACGVFAIDDVAVAGIQFLGAIKEPLLWPQVFGGPPKGDREAVIARAVRWALREWAVA